MASAWLFIGFLIHSYLHVSRARNGLFHGTLHGGTEVRYHYGYMALHIQRAYGCIS